MEELEEMRQQLAVLKDRLDKEKIVNEKLLRSSMKQKASVINRQRWISCLAAGFVIAAMFTSFRPMGCSWGFCIGTSIFMVFCCAMTIWFHRDVSDEAMNEDLLTVAQNVSRLKHRYNEWIKYSIPMMLLWLAWLAYEFYKVADGEMVMFWTLVISAIVGGTIGGIWGYSMHRKVCRMCDEIVEQIKAAE